MAAPASPPQPAPPVKNTWLTWLTWPNAAWLAAGLATINMVVLPSALNWLRYPLNWTLLGVFGLCVAGAVSRQRSGWHKLARIDLGVVALFLAWVVLDFAAHGFRTGDPLTLRGLVSGLLAYLLARVLVIVDGRPLAMQAYLVLTVGLGVFQALLGLVQFAVPDWLPTAYQFVATATNDARIVGSLENPNQYGAFLALVIPLAAGLAWGAFRPALAVRVAALGCLPVLSLALLLSFSRGAQLSLVLGLLTLGGIWSLSRRRLWLGGGFILLLAGLAGLAVWFGIRFKEDYFEYSFRQHAQEHLEQVFAGNAEPTRTAWLYFDHDRDGELDSRDYLYTAHLQEQSRDLRNAQPYPPPGSGRTRWIYRYAWARLFLDQAVGQRMLFFAACVQFWRDSPVWGIGPGNFLSKLDEYVYCPSFKISPIYHAHNLPIQWLAELGLPGLLMFLAVAAWTGRGLFLSFRTNLPAPWVHFLAWSLLAFLIHQLVDTTLWYIPFRYVVPIFFAAWAGCVSRTAAAPASLSD